MLNPLELRRGTSEMSTISESSPLHYILDTGRFKKKFKDIKLIGAGGFGKVYKATNYVDRKSYAIKVIRLHIKKTSSVDEIYGHRVYRELQTTA
jgi:serine/threonine protein kinase